MYDAGRELKTICALASAQGAAAISVVRMSGSEAFKIIQKACPQLKSISSHKAALKNFYNPNGDLLDQVLVLPFSQGKSFTGEESVEIFCHGSSFIVGEILNTLISFGAVSAEKGEFTYRAFMNDKLDLIQAEGVLSTIQAQSKASLKVSLRQLEGHISDKFIHIEDILIWCLAHIEASIDFSTEGIDVVDPTVLTEKLHSVSRELKSIADTYNQGRLVQDGIQISLAGQPNVGKSSLLNCLVLEDRAIVTPIAGTTRDVVFAETNFQGTKFKIADTAGLRETSDLVEKIGVERSLKVSSESDITFFVYDSNSGLSEADLNILTTLQGLVVIVGNKADLLSSPASVELNFDTVNSLYSLKDKNLHQFKINGKIINYLQVSAHLPSTRDKLLSCAHNALLSGLLSQDAVISSARQFEMCNEALVLLQQVLHELAMGTGSEFISQTLKQALLCTQKIIGRVFDDQIMDRVFKEFCIGK